MKKLMVVVVFVILIWSCQKDCTESNHQYVFLELTQYDNIEVLKGECKIPHVVVDYFCYGYSYNPISKLITDYCDGININDSLELMVGHGHETILHGVYSLPYGSNSVKIESVTPDGIVYFYYRDTLKSLKTDEVFEDIEEWMETGYVNYGEQFPDTCIWKFTYTTRLVNHGIFDESNYIHTE